MAFYMKAGRGPMMKTGRGIPEQLTSGGPLQKIKPATQEKKVKVEKEKKKEDKGFFSTVSDAYSNAYEGGKGTAKTSSISQGAPGSGSRKPNKDLLVGASAAIKAGYDYLTKD